MHLFPISGNNNRPQFRQVPGVLKPFYLTLIVALLAGCAASAGYNSTYGGRVSNIGGVVVNQRLSVPSGSKIYLQDGVTKMHSEVKETAPYCYFHLYRSRSVIKTPAVLEPDNFTVTSISHYVSVARHAHSPVQVASSGILFQDASEQTLLTRMKLGSGLQPEVIGLYCGIWAVPFERSYLSLEEIRGSLGNKVSLEISAD